MSDYHEVFRLQFPHAYLSVIPGDDLVHIYVMNDDTSDLPHSMYVLLPDGSCAKVKTKIVSNVGMAKPHLGQAIDGVSDSNSPNYPGSFCCLVESVVPGFKGMVTSGHVFTYGEFYNYGGVLSPKKRRDVYINGQANGTLFFQVMEKNQDLAIVKINDPGGLTDNYISMNKGYYTLTPSDLKLPEPNLTVVSKISGTRQAYVLDYNTTIPMGYIPPQQVEDIILIGSTNDMSTSASVSAEGDSGGCVYHTSTGRLVGMILGGNAKFTFVLPVEDTLNQFHFKPI